MQTQRKGRDELCLVRGHGGFTEEEMCELSSPYYQTVSAKREDRGLRADQGTYGGSGTFPVA